MKRGPLAAAGNREGAASAQPSGSLSATRIVYL